MGGPIGVRVRMLGERGVPELVLARVETVAGLPGVLRVSELRALEFLVWSRMVGPWRI